MTRVAVYARVSTEDQAKEGFSLGAQKDRLRAYCQARGWDIVGEYVDDGHSGRDTKRPAYQRMMEEMDRWDVILVIKMDRIHRNSRNFMEMMEKLNEWGKGFTSMQESFDTSTAMGRFVMDIIQRIAQLESEQIGERVYMGMDQKAKKGGGVLGFNHPYGYDYVSGILVPNPEESKVVRDIFRTYLSGLSTSEIAKHLNERGVTSKRGGEWSKQAVLKILKNPLYCGFLHWEGHSFRWIHEPLVSAGQFNKAQEEIARRIRVARFKHEPKLLQARSEEDLQHIEQASDYKAELLEVESVA